jgi:hypothetical protein
MKTQINVINPVMITIISIQAISYAQSAWMIVKIVQLELRAINVTLVFIFSQLQKLVRQLVQMAIIKILLTELAIHAVIIAKHAVNLINVHHAIVLII